MGGFILKSTTEDQILWEQRIEERNKSGMSISEWCKKNEISKNRFHYWNKKISKGQKSDNEVAFAEITSIISDKPKSIPTKSVSGGTSIDYKKLSNSLIYSAKRYLAVPSIGE